VAEARDRQPAQEVEPGGAVGVEQRRALPADERAFGGAVGRHDVGGGPLGAGSLEALAVGRRGGPPARAGAPRAGRDRRRGDHRADALVGEDLDQHGVQHPAVEDVGLRDTPSRIAATIERTLGPHALVELVGGRASLQPVDADLAHQRLLVRVAEVEVEPGDVGEVDELGGPERRGDGAGGQVGVDVALHAVGVAADGGDHRQEPVGEQLVEVAGVDVLDLADEAEVLAVPGRRRGGPAAARRRCRRPRPRGRRPPGPADDLGVDLAEQRHADHVHHRGVGDPQPADELDSTPSCSASSLICGPPPWTMTGRSPTKCSRATSAAKERLSSSSTMALPPYLITMVWPWKRVIHGSASRSTAAFSWAASTRSVETWSAVVMRRPPAGAGTRTRSVLLGGRLGLRSCTRR
jgi:hypothetical protein